MIRKPVVAQAVAELLGLLNYMAQVISLRPRKHRLDFREPYVTPSFL